MECADEFLSFCIVLGLPIYEKESILKRWQKEYNVGSHQPEDGVIRTGGITYVPRVPQGAMRPLESRAKFKRISEITRELNTVASDCGTREFHERLQLLEDVKLAWLNNSKIALVHINSAENQSNAVHIFLIFLSLLYVTSLITPLKQMLCQFLMKKSDQTVRKWSHIITTAAK